MTSLLNDARRRVKSWMPEELFDALFSVVITGGIIVICSMMVGHVGIRLLLIKIGFSRKTAGLQGELSSVLVFALAISVFGKYFYVGEP